MSDVYSDGNVRVAWVPSISTQAAPTTTELNAGLLLTTLLTADGLMGFEASTAEVDTTSLASTFDTKGIGRDQFSSTGLRLKKQSGTDTAYTTLVRGTAGYIVVRRDIAFDTAWASTQPVEVYPVICGQTKILSPEANSVRKYEVPTPITSAPSLRAAVA